MPLVPGDQCEHLGEGETSFLLFGRRHAHSADETLRPHVA